MISKRIEPFEWCDDPNLVSHDTRSARVLIFSIGATQLAASSSCSLLNNHWSLCTPKGHIYLKVILVQLNSWESHCLSLPLVAILTNWQRSGRHSIVCNGTSFWLFRATATATPTTSALRLTKMSVIWQEESLFIGRRVIVGGAIVVIWASETNFVWNYQKSSETIQKCLKLIFLKVLCLKGNENVLK
jgi:hypothetical protein